MSWRASRIWRRPWALVQAEGRSCLAIRADARSEAEMAAAASAALEEFGKIDALCVSHGVFSVGSWEVTEADWDAVVDANMKGVWLTCKAVIPHTIERGAGVITVTVSTAGLRGYYGCLPYVASKHGAIGIVRQLAPELAAHSVRINAVCPTTVNTPMVINPPTLSLFSGERRTRPRRTLRSRFGPCSPPGPMDRSAGRLQCALRLISDEARYVTGIALPIDAGQLAQPAGIPPEAATLLAELSQ